MMSQSLQRTSVSCHWAKAASFAGSAGGEQPAIAVGAVVAAATCQRSRPFHRATHRPTAHFHPRHTASIAAAQPSAHRPQCARNNAWLTPLGAAPGFASTSAGCGRARRRAQHAGAGTGAADAAESDAELCSPRRQRVR